MAKISPGIRSILQIILASLLGCGLAAIAAVGIFHIPLTAEGIIGTWLGAVVSGMGAWLFTLAPTRPRLAAVLWAGVWALVVAGLSWIIEALISGSILNLEVSTKAAILPLTGALITWAAAYWWYRQHPVIPAAYLREPRQRHEQNTR
jgi:hypothetical protein